MPTLPCPRGPLAVLAVTLALAVGSLPSTTASAEPDPSPQVTLKPGEPLIDAPAKGKAAIAELGDQLATASSRNDMRPGEFKELILEDPTAWIDTEGRIFYVDPPRAAKRQGSAALPAPLAPLSETFALHSNPGASRTILLDFDGAQVSGTAWNDQAGVTPGTHPAWDPDLNGPAFSTSEQARIQQIWAMVAEDYAPFDVDVTTEDTGDAAIIRESGADSVYGTRVLITPSNDPFVKICNSQCGGVAYMSVFGETGGYYQPAWVFPQGLGDDTKAVAEAASHEAGHNLGLEHDGTSSQSYYTGHGAWAPIMGVGYDRPIVQWSAGSYPGANNRQDDVAILRGYLGSRPDEAPDSPGTPAPLPAGESLIGSRADVDAFLLGRCPTGTSVQVSPAAVSPNLDVRLELYDAAGALRAVSEPPSSAVNRHTADGLGASLSIPAGQDNWTVTVQGVGQGSWNTAGYDDYASMGAYTIAAPGCDGQTVTGVPGAPTNVTADVLGHTALTLTWSAPADTGNSPVTGYVLTRSGAATSVQLPATARSHTFSDLAPNTTYAFSVRAVNGTGAGSSAGVSATTTKMPSQAPSAPQNLTASYDEAAGAIDVSWTAPSNSGSEPLSDYLVYFEGQYLGRVDPQVTNVTITSKNGFPAGTYELGVAAKNVVGPSPIARTTVTIGQPDRPLNDDAASAQIISGPSGFVDGDNTHATSEPTDPIPPSASNAGGFSTWYSWTPSGTGRTTMATSGGDSTRDTTLAVYTGAPGSLTHVAGDDDSGDGWHARVDFTAQAGVRYLVVVDGFAGRAGGTGPYRLTWSQTIATPPGSPTNVKARAGTNQAVVSWAAPRELGSGTLTGYTVTSTPGNKTCTTTGALTCTVKGLTNGTRYTFSVQAASSVGTSPRSAASATIVPFGKPLAPRLGKAVSGTAKRGINATAVWQTAGANGSAIKGYLVRAYAVSRTGSLRLVKTSPLLGASTRRLVMPLKAGRYRFRVVAKNAVGLGQPSAPSNIVVAR